jgi:hypothetical protein
MLVHRVLLNLRSARSRAGHLFGRILQLEAPAHDGVVRFLTGISLSLDGDKHQSWVTVTRVGKFTDPRYGEFEITPKMLTEMVENFNKRTYGQDIFVDISHNPSGGAAGTITKLEIDNGKLRALVDWTEHGVTEIKRKGFRYLSAEYTENYVSNETKASHGALLLGAGVTIRPVIKRLDPIQLAEETGTRRVPTLLSPDVETTLTTEIRTMWRELIKKLTEALGKLKLAEPVVKQLTEAAEKAIEKITDEAVATIVLGSFEAVGKNLADTIGSQAIKLDLSGLPTGTTQAGLTAEDVRKLMADEAKKLADDQKKAADAVDANRKLLADTIGAAKDLPDEVKKELAEGVRDLITGELTADQVKALAANQLAHANRTIAARKLAAMGWASPDGKVHIDMGSPGEIAQLQEKVDQRLGFAAMPAEVRFQRTGKLLDHNKRLAERALELYDRQNGPRLLEEHKRLAAGVGSVSDVAVPAIFERTVIREALYDLISTAFMDVGTAPFADTIRIHYSYRDTTAAGINNLRKYEGQAIARSGVIQTYESAYPLPQKLSFRVSDEVRLLSGNGQIDYDIVSENVMNASRIIGEDTERTNFNEISNASDQYATATVTNEAVATANGTNTIFALDHFPVVRPKLVYDLKGNQVGSTLYPITVKSNAVTRTEYDGTGTQASGLYWYMDYNLGEVHFVTELGAPSAPTNTHAIVVTYTYSTNAATFDTDLGSDAIDAHWDKFLYAFGLRKAAIEDGRYYNVNMALMSGTLRTQAEQARQFAANYQRAGTNLTTDGNLGIIKGVPAFKTTAPGLNIGDTRTVIGLRGTSRLRVCKPWAMEALENARDTSGNFTAQKEAYGTQWIVSHTPTQLKGAYTSLILYSGAGRVDRAS